jgi:hypothetical protein
VPQLRAARIQCVVLLFGCFHLQDVTWDVMSALAAVVVHIRVSAACVLARGLAVLRQSLFDYLYVNLTLDMTRACGAS